jgi:hypothetical protein
MKKNVLKHALIFTILLNGLFLGITNLAFSQPDPGDGGDGYGVINSTICCRGGVKTGNSNDCGQGEGNCVNHHCASGETETQNLLCP